MNAKFNADGNESVAQAFLLFKNKEYSQAERMLATLLEIEPENAEALHVLSLLQSEMSQLGKAIASAKEAVRIKPDNAPLQYALGNLYLDQGDPSSAAKGYERAVKINPQFYEAWNNLGLALQDQQQLNTAEYAFRQALKIRPTSPNAIINLASVFKQAGQDLEAFELLEKSALSNPVEKRLLQNLENLGYQIAHQKAKSNQTNQAIEIYCRLTNINTNNLRAKLEEGLTLPPVYANPDEQKKYRARYSKKLNALCKSFTPQTLAKLSHDACFLGVERENFLLAYQGEDDHSLQEKYSKLIGGFLDLAVPHLRQPIQKKPTQQKLRIGFASAFIRDCTVGHYFKSWITDLNSEKFIKYIYLLGESEDRFTEEIKNKVDQTRKLVGPLPLAAETIYADKLDILVYPELGMNGRAFALAALRLAPIQCAGWGHPVTTGHATIDYFLSSGLMEPDAGDAHYSEQLIRLPGLGTRYTQPVIEKTIVRAQYGIPPDAHLYLIPHALFKIHPENDLLFARILELDAKALLVCFAGETAGMTDAFMARLNSVLSTKNINPTRVRVLPLLPRADYLALNCLCDVSLDTTRWSGGNTTLDALACTLPIVTRWGRFMRGRQTAGMLKAMHLEMLIAEDDDSYVSTAIRICSDQVWSESIKNTIRRNRPIIFGDSKPVLALEEFLTAAAFGRPPPHKVSHATTKA